MMMGLGMGGIWLAHLGILGIVDSILMKREPEDGRASGGRMAWAIIILIVAGLSSLQGLSGIFNGFSILGYMAEEPMILIDFLCSLLEVTLTVFMVLASINRVRSKAPGFNKLRLIFGIILAVFGMLSFTSGMMHYM